MENKNNQNFERYKLLINARNFHYDNFNKWMTYFYVANGALFIAYYTLKSSDSNDNILEYILLVLGYIVSLFWYWSCKGYYYWNINFITLVNNYEENILKLEKDERVYFVFANKGEQNDYINPISGANISTSKVAILFAFVVTTVWGLLFSYKLILETNYFQNYEWLKILILIILSVFSVILISYFIPKRILKSKIDHFPDLKIEQKKNK